jgi:hypothetical protein
MKSDTTWQEASMRERPRFMLRCVECGARTLLASPVQEMAPQINEFRELHQHGAPGLNIRIQPVVTMFVPVPRSAPAALVGS